MLMVADAVDDDILTGNLLRLLQMINIINPIFPIIFSVNILKNKLYLILKIQ